jgi:hypothetical protein
MEDKMNNNSNLKGAIVKAVAFFDLFDYPLTLNEILRNLSVKCELEQVMQALENGINQIASADGFYFLAGRNRIIEERLKRYNFTDRKFKRALIAAKIFKFVPWIKLIAVGNLMGAQNLKDNGDIDLFIITEAKRIWLTRFFCVGAIKFLGWRPRADNSRDKICLSFFAGEDKIDFDYLRLEKDIYFIYWLAGLTPIYDAGGIYKKLIDANPWLKNELPNWRPLEPSTQRLVKSRQLGFYNDFIDIFVGGLEPQFKAWQIKIMPPVLKNLINQDSRVVANDNIIKLHANDRREDYREKYEKKIKL